MKQETVEIQKELFDQKKSALKKYQELIIGQKGLWKLIKYEFIITFFSSIPGALGLVLRMKLYPRLLGKVGRNVTFGQNVVLRHPHKIEIGDNVVIDDNVVLDAKGQDNQGIKIGSGAFIGRNTIFNCKNGDIILGDNANFGPNCQIFSANKVEFGKNALIASYTYFVGGTHNFDSTDKSPLEQGRQALGITIGDNIWVGAGASVLDGVKIGRDCIIGTGAVVNSNIPAFSIAVGMPAKVIKDRRNKSGPRRRSKNKNQNFKSQAKNPKSQKTNLP
jgi:acetyltransferase-like isoleucine patch superfamily enzyme